MEELTLEQMQKCITDTFEHYDDGRFGNLYVDLDNKVVEVSCNKIGTRFNCGPRDYYIKWSSADDLRIWCRDNPGAGWGFGFRGTNAHHLTTVNITLINRNELMFNFHVKLG